MRKSVIFVNYKGMRLADRITNLAYMLRLFDIDQYQTLYDIHDDVPESFILRIHGVGFVVSLLRKISELRMNGPEGKKDITTKGLDFVDFVTDRL